MSTAGRWGWNAYKNTTQQHGGGTGGHVVGSPEEARQRGAWPKYEAEHLAQKLHSGSKLAKIADQYITRRKVPAEVHETIALNTFYDKVSEGYKEEADQCLQQEFSDWLMGEHPANAWAEQAVTYAAEGHPEGKGTWGWNYNKDPDAPVRYQWRKMAGGIDEASEEDARDNQWVSTPWGKTALTHLPGVRDKLRADHEATKKAQFKMNVLAEFGPQNLDEAWMYFKHWVKGRPVKAECFPAREEYSLPGGGGDTIVEGSPTPSNDVNPGEVNRAYFGFQTFPDMLPREGPPVDPDGAGRVKPATTYAASDLTAPHTGGVRRWNEEQHGCLPTKSCDTSTLEGMAKGIAGAAAATAALGRQMTAFEASTGAALGALKEAIGPTMKAESMTPPTAPPRDSLAPMRETMREREAAAAAAAAVSSPTAAEEAAEAEEAANDNTARPPLPPAPPMLRLKGPETRPLPPIERVFPGTTATERELARLAGGSLAERMQALPRTPAQTQLVPYLAEDIEDPRRRLGNIAIPAVRAREFDATYGYDEPWYDEPPPSSPPKRRSKRNSMQILMEENARQAGLQPSSSRRGGGK